MATGGQRHPSSASAASVASDPGDELSQQVRPSIIGSRRTQGNGARSVRFPSDYRVTVQGIGNRLSSVRFSSHAAVIGRGMTVRNIALKHISFDDPALLRGSLSTDALRHWGAVFDQSQGTGDWYSLSEIADHLDVFVSHNWSMPRREKFLILALHLNMKAAVLSTALVVVVIMPFSVAGLLPTVISTPGHNTDDWWMGPWCQLFGLAVFIVILTCRQEFCRIRPCRGTLLFLDRACIHQSNDLLRQRGIEHLAAFLYYLWSLLICYSDEYLQKLWTVYQVSSFMLLHPGSAIHVRHAWFTKFLIGGVVVVFLFNLAWHTGVLGSSSLQRETAGFLVSASCMVPASVAIAAMLLKITAIRTNMSERIRRFCFAEAKCYDERDRMAVQHNIIDFMKHNGHVAEEASDADIILEFEAMVQSDVPKLFAAALGRVGFPYHFAACIPLPCFLQSIDYACGGVRQGIPTRAICLVFACNLTMTFALFPLTLAISFMISRGLAQDCRIGQTGSVCILAASIVVIMAGGRALLATLLSWAVGGDHMGLGVFVAMVACFSLPTLFFYLPRAYQEHHRSLRGSHMNSQ